MLNFEVDYTSAKKVEEYLRGLDEALGATAQREVLRKIGNLYLADTIKRFENQHNPDRKPWAALKPSTVKLKTYGYKGRDSSIDAPTRRGVWTGKLLNSLAFRIEGNSVIIGTNVDYAPYFHYRVNRFKKLGGNRSAPWGQIPARRFLGRNTRIDGQVLKLYSDEIQKRIGINPNSISSAV